MTSPDLEHLRREMIGAFVHEMRTPLTSIRMILDIAKRSTQGPDLVIDAELHEMLEGAIGELQELANSLQEGSRLERGKVEPARTSCQLEEVFADVATALGEELRVETGLEPGICGRWDRVLLPVAIGGIVHATYRCGDGDSTVRSEGWRRGDVCHLRFESGVAGGERKPLNADLGYPFFRAVTILKAMGGDVLVERAERFCAIEVRLPLNAG